ncbi:MAG: hypothetical protein HY812_21695, partial [Planctomycetes bacterium]|nr:hypothetical protein [Planctomycetota bacterium]
LTAASAPVFAQAQAPARGLAKADGPPQSTEPFLPIPDDVELGEAFSDKDWGFEFRLPKGMRPRPDMEEWRKTVTVDEEKRTVDGTVGKVQQYQFVTAGSANILILVHEPPLRIDAPSALRRRANEQDKQFGRPLANYGKLYRVRGIGQRIGFLASRDFGTTPGSVTTHRQGIAYYPGLTRSYLIQYTAEIDDFASLERDFYAALATFAIQDGKPPTAKDLAPARGTPGFASLRVIGNVALLAALLLLLVSVLRRFRSRGGGATPTSA